jgi:O-antigen/teichoic acid export membrane protein
MSKDQAGESIGAPSGHAVETREALVRNVSFGVVARAGYLLTRVFIPPFVVARIGLSAYGLWNAVFLIVGYVGISSIGFTSAYVKLIAEYIGQDDTRKANSILSTGMVICGVICGVVFIVLALSMSKVLRWLSVPNYLQQDAYYVILLVVGIHCAAIVLSVYSSALAGCQRLFELQVISICGYLLQAVLIFWLVGTGHGVRGLADAFAISTVISTSFGIIVARRKTPWLHVSPLLLSRESGSRLLSFGGVLQLGALLAQGLETAERVIAAPLVGLDAVGVLDIGAKLPRMSGTIPGAFVDAFIPASSYLQAGLAGGSNGRQVIKQLYLKGSRYTMLLTATMLGLMATAASPILMVWMGRIYPGTAYLMTIFSVQQHFDCMTGPGTSMLRGIGRPWQEFAYTVPNILLAAAFIPFSHLVLGKWSAIGLGTAVALAQVIASIVFLVRANGLFEVSWWQYCRMVFLPSLIPYAVGGLFVVPLSHFIASTGRWNGVAVLGLSGTFYAIVSTLLIDRIVLARDERLWFRHIARQRWIWCMSVRRKLFRSLRPRAAWS